MDRKSNRLTKEFIPIAATVLFLCLNSFGQIPSDQYLSIEINNLSETNFSGIVSNTEPDVQYEIQRKQSSTNWISMGVILSSETTNWTPFSFKIRGEISAKTVLRVSEHESGDLKVWVQYTNQVVQGRLYDWSAGIEVINGGLYSARHHRFMWRRIINRQPLPPPPVLEHADRQEMFSLIRSAVEQGVTFFDTAEI